jgi:hypothetical protein
MAGDRQTTLAEIEAQLAGIARLNATTCGLPDKDKERAKRLLPHGRDVLEPLICTIEGVRQQCRPILSDEALKILHNEQSGKTSYPLNITSGFFFSEALGPKNENAEEYHRLVSESLSVILDACDSKGVLAFEYLDSVGARIQNLDAEFATTKINKPQDRVHQCYGPNSQHPYSKITLCRTAIPVALGDKVMSFFFEKFLVAYSYLDKKGKRKSTVTPLHSHPLCYETAYFTSYGQGSHVVEQEFHFVRRNGELIVGADGVVDAEYVAHADAERFGGIMLKAGEMYVISATDNPVILNSFVSDAALKSALIIEHVDGLFRPHRVTVYDDPEATRETLYYAIDNYFGPKGRVLVFSEDGQIDLWSHDDWG